MAGIDQFRQELVTLRRGRALQAARLRPRVGPHMRAACDVHEPDSDQTVRRNVTTMVQKLTSDFPPDLRLAIGAALAIEGGAAGYPKLEDREGWLAEELHCSVRSARRRVEEATDLLAEVLRERVGAERPRDPEQGWCVTRLSALLCLDAPAPMLYEERSIVATRDDLATIRTRCSLPRGSCDVDILELQARVLHGARLTEVERLGDTHFRHTLVLSRVLRQGEASSYEIMYQLPPGQPMFPHYVYHPLAPCEAFHVRVRFDPGNPPERIWRLDRVAPRMLDEEPAHARPLALDASGDLSQHFTDLVQGFGYGVAWRPAAVPGAGTGRQQETGR